MIMFFLGLIFTPLLSAYSIRALPDFFDIPFTFNLIPGILFGIFVLFIISFSGREKPSARKQIGFILISALAYIAAVCSAIFSFGLIEADYVYLGSEITSHCLVFFFAGLVGGFILLAVGLKLLLKLISWNQVFILTVLSGCSGIVSVFGRRVTNSIENNFPFLSLFLVWQIAMSVAILIFTKKTTN